MPTGDSRVARPVEHRAGRMTGAECRGQGWLEQLEAALLGTEAEVEAHVWWQLTGIAKDLESLFQSHCCHCLQGVSLCRVAKRAEMGREIGRWEVEVLLQS